jgi:Ni2+-binding GTPase involved in maturation of urease and hydrogenase
MRKNIKRFSKILVQAEEAFMRWEILNETVRELQCNLYKGLHEDNAYYEAKAKQLREWAKTLNLDFLQIINKAGELMSSVSKKIRLQKKEQFRWN